MIMMDGKALAKQIEADLTARVPAVIERCGGQVPTLATILVGDDPSSAVYVKMKGNACRRVGMESIKIELPKETTTEQLLAEIEGLNRRDDVHGILLQHPVPSQIDERACFDAIDLLAHYQIPLKGKDAVVVGRSPILGKPVAMMLLNEHATVTVCHSRTRDLPAIVGRADIVVGALGKPEFIKGSWIKDGAVVVDAGYHPEKVGDIELATVIDRCHAYTPVPGGVGPMTIASLIAHTLDAAELQAARRG